MTLPLVASAPADRSAMALDSGPLRLRQRLSALDETRRQVGDALAVEHAARQARTAAEVAIAAETRVAMASDSDAEVERFARWLRHGQARLVHAEAALAEAITATTYKRAELTLVRAAAQSTAKALRRRHDVVMPRPEPRE